MKVFITKYALTTGIEEKYAQCFLDSPGMIRDGNGNYFHGEGREWHRTHEAAVARAEEMRVSKLASLHKSIKKMESLDFKKAKA